MKSERSSDTKKSKKISFFEKLKQQEAEKQQVGTFHAIGKPLDDENPVEKSKDWECVKPGCGKVNDRRSTQCQKCRAMRRISTYR